MMENYSLSDIAAATNGTDGLGNSGSWILILLFAMIFGWNGNGYGRNGNGEFSQYATAASQQEILFGQQFQTLNQAINKVGDGLCSSTYALNNAITSEGRSLSGQLAECCCTTQRGIDSINYNGAINTAAINANTTAQIQKVLDKMCTDQMAQMQNQINQLQLQNAVAGVVRYPNSWAYNAGTSPFCACNNCGSI